MPKGRRKRKASKPGREITQRERQILVQLVQGRTNEEIAEQLGIKTSTVKSLMCRFMQKTGKRNRTELAVSVCLGFSPNAEMAELLVANIPLSKSRVRGG